jgi:hypothetical protein
MVSISDYILKQSVSYKRKWIADRKKKHPEVNWEELLDVKRSGKKSETD